MIAQVLALSVSLAPLHGAVPSAQAKAAFQQGEEALAGNDLAGAEAAYQRAISASPGYAEAINGLGSVYFKEGKREQAIAQFQKAIDANPNFPLAHFNLGFAARKTGDFATAARAYEQYTRLKPEDPDGFYGLGESYRQLGENGKAIAAYEQYVQREKRPTEQKWKDKANGYIAELKAQPAAPAPEQAHPAQTEPEQTASAGQADTQPPTAQPQVTAQPDLARRKIAEGDQHMAQKQYRDASFAYQDALNADADNVEALFKLANTYAVLGYYTQAIARWNRVIELSDDPGVKKSAQDNIARAQQKMTEAGGGTPQVQGKAPGSGPIAPATRQQARAAYEQGVRQIGSRDYNGALKSLTQALQLDPTLAVAYVARGSALIGQRRYAEAAADYQYASRLDPSISSPLYGLAEAYRALGRTADARSFYEKYAASTAADARPELQAQARQKAAQLR